MQLKFCQPQEKGKPKPSILAIGLNFEGRALYNAVQLIFFPGKKKLIFQIMPRFIPLI